VTLPIPDARIEIAEQVIAFFKQQDLVKHAFLRGSLASKGGDQFSDIDIGVDVSGSDNGQFLLQGPALLATLLPPRIAVKLSNDPLQATCREDGGLDKHLTFLDICLFIVQFTTS